MPIRKASQPAVASPEHAIAQQAAYLTNKYTNMFKDQSQPASERYRYAYPPAKQSADEAEMRSLEANMAKGGHGVPLSSE